MPVVALFADGHSAYDSAVCVFSGDAANFGMSWTAVPSDGAVQMALLVAHGAAPALAAKIKLYVNPVEHHAVYRLLR